MATFSLHINQYREVLLVFIILVCSQSTIFGFQLPPNGSITNPCNEGEFYNLNSNTCQPLCKPEFGFNINRFNQASSSTIYTLTQCTHSALNNLLNSIGPTGGIIQLPACTIVVSGKIWLKENTIFQGAGIGNTVIQVAPGYSGHVFEMKYIKNSVLRDLTLDGNGQYVTSFIAWYCDNLMVERVEVKDSDRTGINFSYSKNVTVRHCKSTGAGTWHGIASKDCSNANPFPNHSTCFTEAGNTAPGVLWTTSYSVYSNETTYNAGLGINLHGLNGETAGNYSAFNDQGSKFFDGENIWVHHNKFEGNSSWGTAISISIDVPERLPRNTIFYANEFINNGAYPFRVNGDYATEVYLLNNTFIGNTPNEIRNLALPGVLKICPGSVEDQMNVSGNSVSYATPAQCANPCSIDAGECMSVRLKLALEGALTDNNGNYLSEMKTDLYTLRKLLPGQSPIPPTLPTPAGQPYAIAPWNYQGTEGQNFDQSTYQTIAAKYGSEPVDWVLVSLRRTVQSSAYNGRFSGVLLADGTVVLPETCMLPDSIVGSNYIVVEHLNHLPAMSAPVSFDGGYLLYDFTKNAGYTSGNIPTQVQISPGNWALFTGDADKSSDLTGYDINGNDRIFWQAQNGLFNIYSSADHNRDGNIDGLDNILWSRNNGIFSIIQK